MDVSGTVIKGIQANKKGFKTANIQTTIEKGVYVCSTNYGKGFAVCTKKGLMEVHIIGFEGSIYGEKLVVKDIKEIDKRMFLLIGLSINGVEI